VRGKKTGGFTFVFNTALEKEAKYVRQRPKEAVGLLVVVDGDQVGQRGRLAQIQEVLRLAGFETKDKMPDQIAACIPSRNVETWELWLCGFLQDPDEQRDFKLLAQRKLEGISRRQLIDAWFAPPSEEQSRIEADLLPALVHGRSEIERLQRVAKS
jgi:hypothetical protein